MDVRTEGKAEIKYFQSTLNDILTELADDGQPNLFNPEKIMVDEAGANMTGVVEEFRKTTTETKLLHISGILHKMYSTMQTRYPHHTITSQ